MATDFAVVKINSKQYLVEKDGRFTIDSVAKDTQIDVMMAGIGDELMVGEPVLGNFGVKIQVVSEGKGDKLVVRRYKSKSRYRKNKGHRQPISTLKVIDLGKNVKNELVWDEAPKAEAKEQEQPVAKKAPKAKTAPKKAEAKPE